MRTHKACLRLPLVMALCLGMLVACAKRTYYSPAVNGFGYDERQIEPGHYQVVFAGNHLTRRETAHQYVLFRAAQLANQDGYRYVAVNDQTQRIERYGDLRARPTERLDLGREDGGGSSSLNRNSNNRGQVRSTVERYQAILDVSFYNDADNVPKASREVYETDTVLAKLGKNIEFEDESKGGNYFSGLFSRTGRSQ